MTEPLAEPFAEAPPYLGRLASRELALLAGVSEYAQYIARWAQDKGFWDMPGVLAETEVSRKALIAMQKSQKLMLIVSELGEALEALRKPVESKVAGFSNEEEEIADAVIRLLDYAGHYNLRLAECIIAKMLINEGRPHRHGKNF